jgi:VWFA-related protein
MFFSVSDKHGKPVRDLSKDQFLIFDNGKPPKQIVAFEAQSDVPLRIGLVIDASNSMRENMHFVQQALVPFVQKLRPGSDKSFVLTFNEALNLQADLTNDQSKLAEGIGRIHAGGATSMWDAVYYACRDKLMKEQAPVSVRRAIVLISDGDDNQSHVTAKEAIQEAERAAVTLYVLSPKEDWSPYTDGDHNVKMLAEATGGLVFSASSLKAMNARLDEVANDLRSQYSVSYVPDAFEHDGQFRSTKIETVDKKLKVHASKGYFAPKQ